MIYLIIKSYLAILLSIGIGAVCVFIMGLCCIFKFGRSSKKTHDLPMVDATPAINVTAIAGEDTFATQLDLARAYIETGSKPLAKKLLEEVITQGNPIQQEEARTLLGLL